MTPPPRAFLIVHGYRNRRPSGHWQRWLAERLLARGERVIYPQLPVPDRPDAARWLEALHDAYARLGGDEPRERVVICHSLGCALWHLAARDGLPSPADRVLLVAPAGPSELARERLQAFAAPWHPGALAASSQTRIRLVASDDDPTCPEGPAARLYGQPLGLDAETIPGAGHLSASDGYGPWPDVLRWCTDPTTRLARPRHGGAPH